MGVSVVTAHAVTALIEELQEFLHALGTADTVENTGLDHVLLIQIKKINFRISHLKNPPFKR